jgi:hypothetical protein
VVERIHVFRGGSPHGTIVAIREHGIQEEKQVVVAEHGDDVIGKALAEPTHELEHLFKVKRLR